MINAFAAALASLCVSASTPDQIHLFSRYSNTAQSLMSLKCSLKCDSARTVVPEPLYIEGKALYIKAKSDGVVPLLVAPAHRTRPVQAAAAQGRRYATRKTLTVPMAAAITGLSESTIKRLDKDPRNTNYPGRNATAKILAAWAKLYKGERIAVREVRAANRPLLGHSRS